MQTENLFELTYILLEKKQVTAGEMAEHFGVSQRTIYRWVDALNLAGVPVYSTKGKGGGIHVSEKYALDKTVFTDSEKEEILSSLNALNALSGQTNSAVSKLRSLVSSDKNTDWIKVEFANWNPEQNEIKELFKKLKMAIINRRQVSFEYFSGSSESSRRQVDSWKIVFRGQAWYLYGFCKKRDAPRYFKLSRMKNLQILKEEISTEEKDFLDETQRDLDSYLGNKVTKFVQLKLKVAESEVYRILDEYLVDSIEDGKGKTKIVTLSVPDEYWLKYWILSFGASMQVLKPKRVRDEIRNEVEKIHRAI